MDQKLITDKEYFLRKHG